MSGAVIKKPSRITILIANTFLALDVFILFSMVVDSLGDIILATFATYMMATFFLFTIFDVGGNEDDL
jgi:hypothetical protein